MNSHISPPRTFVPPRAISVFVLVLFLIVSAPVLLSRVPMFDDYPNHLARAYVIGAVESDPLLSQYYGIHWALIPNLAFDLIVPPLAQSLGFFSAGKVFVLLTMALLLTGPLAIYRANFGGWSFAPLVSALFLYNQAAAYGLLNYLFGVGLALWGVAAWIAWHGRHWLLRAGVSLTFILALFTCHLAAVGLYGIALFSYELWFMRARQPTSRHPSNIAVFLLPFAIVPLLWLGGPGGHESLGVINWNLKAKIVGVWYIVKAYSIKLDLAIGVICAGGALWALWQGALRLLPVAVIFLIVSGLVYLAMPGAILGASIVDARLPIALLLILLGLVEWNLSRTAARVFIAVLLALTLFRTAVVESIWHQHDEGVADMERSFKKIDPGSKVLVGQILGAEYLGPYYSLPCLAMMERSSLVSLAFSNPRQQVLTVKPPFRAITGGYDDDPPPITELQFLPTSSRFAPSGRIYWKDWPQNYDYLYLLSSDHQPNPMPDRLMPLDEGHGFQLYRIKR